MIDASPITNAKLMTVSQSSPNSGCFRFRLERNLRKTVMMSRIRRVMIVGQMASGVGVYINIMISWLVWVLVVV